MRLANRVQSFVVNLLALAAFTLLLPINLKRWNPKSKQACDPHQTPILFIPGLFGTSAHGWYIVHCLKKAGFKNVFTTNIGTPFNTIEQHSLLVQEKIENIKYLTQRDDITLLGYSMGGLIAQDYRYTYAENSKITVKKIITLGTPLAGSKLANPFISIFKIARQLYYPSPFASQLQLEAEKDMVTHYYHIGTKVDKIVIPSSSSIASKSKLAKSDMLETTGHIGFLFSNQAIDLIIKELSKTANR